MYIIHVDVRCVYQNPIMYISYMVSNQGWVYNLEEATNTLGKSKTQYGKSIQNRKVGIPKDYQCAYPRGKLALERENSKVW